MNNIRQKSTFSLIVTVSLFILGITSTMNAEEGGTGHYLPGGSATMIDTASTQEGWVLQPIFLHYSADFSKIIPISGAVSTGLKVDSDSITFGGLYTFEEKLFGAYYTAGAYIPFVTLEITGNIDTFSRKDKVTSLGDITFIPIMLAWQSGVWQYDVILSIYAPTGDYAMEQLANTGLNYWTFDSTVGATYSNETTGLTCTLLAGVTFNTENEDTHYKSGSVLHVETSIQQLIPMGKGILGIGLNAYLYEQIEEDSGSGATLGDFKGSSMGVGPLLSYILPYESGTWIFEGKWIPERNTDNRLEGDYVWFKAAWQF